MARYNTKTLPHSSATLYLFGEFADEIGLNFSYVAQYYAFFSALQAQKSPALARDKAKIRSKFLQDLDIPIRQLLGPLIVTLHKEVCDSQWHGLPSRGEETGRSMLVIPQILRG